MKIHRTGCPGTTHFFGLPESHSSVFHREIRVRPFRLLGRSPWLDSRLKPSEGFEVKLGTVAIISLLVSYSVTRCVCHLNRLDQYYPIQSCCLIANSVVPVDVADEPRKMGRLAFLACQMKLKDAFRTGGCCTGNAPIEPVLRSMFPVAAAPGS